MKNALKTILLVSALIAVAACNKKEAENSQAAQIAALAAQLQELQAQLDAAKSGDATPEEIAKMETAIARIAQQELEAIQKQEADDDFDEDAAAPSGAQTNAFQMNGTVLTKYTGSSDIVVIPAGVTSIGDRAFSQHYYITNVTIPSGVTSIGNDAFAFSNNLTSVTIPNSVTTIGERAFASTGLTSITIPNSVTSIGAGAFGGCRALTAINVDIANTSFGSIDGVLYNRERTTIIRYPMGKADASFTIPNTVNNIGTEAFRSCYKLTSLTIPNSVTSVESEAFQSSPGINITWNYNPAFTANNFRNHLRTVIIPNGVSAIGEGAFSGCEYLTTVTMPGSVASIGKDAFARCERLTGINLPNSVTSIGEGAFNNSGLTSITLPDNVTTIGEGAFSNCTGLTRITLGNSLTSISKDAFARCEKLAGITLPDSVTSIGEGAFNNCTGLTRISLGNGVTIINKDAFNSCRALTSITIPVNVQNIGVAAFNFCTNLTSVTFQGWIPWGALHDHAFSHPRGAAGGGIGDLRNKYLTGGPGLYARTNPEINGGLWMRQ